MTFETFEKIIKALNEAKLRSRALYDLKISLIDYDELYYNAINILLTEVFGSAGYDWIMWYLYEREFSSRDKAPLKAYNAQGEEICYDVRSLWETVNDKSITS